MKELPEIKAMSPAAFVWGSKDNFTMRLEGGAMIGVIEGKPLLGWDLKGSKEALINELELMAFTYTAFAERLRRFAELYREES